MLITCNIISHLSCVKYTSYISDMPCVNTTYISDMPCVNKVYIRHIPLEYVNSSLNNIRLFALHYFWDLPSAVTLAFTTSTRTTFPFITSHVIAVCLFVCLFEQISVFFSLLAHLHVSILNAVMDHLHKMPCAIPTNLVIQIRIQHSWEI